jgi:hypothetical protein
MAEFKGTNATRRLASPSEKVSVQDQGGRRRVIMDEYTVPVGGHIANDTVVLGQIPKGAKIINGRIVVKVANGAALTMDLGWKANGAEAASANGLINNADMNTVGFVSMAANGAGMEKTFSDAVDVVATFDGAALAGLKFSHQIEYSLD